MPPRKRKAAQQPGWPEKAVQAAEEARAAAVQAKEPSYTFEWTEGGSKKKKTMWIVNAKAPTIYDRHAEEADGSREKLRPSKIAKAAGKRTVREACVADGVGVDAWEEHDEYLPDEEDEHDVGWKAGPVTRELPRFTGKEKGVAIALLSESTSVADVGKHFVTDELCTILMDTAIAHAKWYRRQHNLTNWRALKADKIESSVKLPRLAKDHIRVWLAARIRAARLAHHIPVKWLFSPDNDLFDFRLASVLTYPQYQWFNRHVSFSKFSENAPSAGEAGYDRFRKRREAFDLINKISRDNFNPGQHIGMDDGSRSHKHLGRRRIRFKTGVHSGALFDSVN